MASGYPALLTLVMLFTAIVAAGAGLFVSGGAAGIDLGAAGQLGSGSDEGLCMYSDTSSRAVVIDNTVEVAGGSETQFGFTVPEDGAAVRINARPLTVTTPRLVIEGPENNTLLQLQDSRASDREIVASTPGNYQLRIISDSQGSSEVEVEVRIGAC